MYKLSRQYEQNSPTRGKDSKKSTSIVNNSNSYSKHQFNKSKHNGSYQTTGAKTERNYRNPYSNFEDLKIPVPSQLQNN